MEIEILEKSKDSIKIKVIGEDHTFLNALTKELWNDKNTQVAGYEIEHSLTEDPVLTLQTKGDPVKAINEAVDRLKKQNKEFKDKFTAIIK